MNVGPRVVVGTCGFSYADWVGPVYPPRTRPGEMLERYADRFVTVEVDSTYYRVPNAATFASMARRTPPGFQFSVKLPQAATHLPDARDVHDDVLRLRRNIEPLIEAGKFACLLMQFPNAFHPTPATYDYLGRLREALADVALVAEFRHRAWQTDETLALLGGLAIGIANVDQPHFETLLRASSEVTSDIAYIRFHGRNAANWWRGTNETRYDYLYSPAELEPWTNRVVDLAANPRVREVFAYFNNHRGGQAVRNAEMFEAMLAQRVAALVRQAPRPNGPLPTSLELPFS